MAVNSRECISYLSPIWGVTLAKEGFKLKPQTTLPLLPPPKKVIKSVYVQIR